MAVTKHVAGRVHTLADCTSSLICTATDPLRVVGRCVSDPDDAIVGIATPPPRPRPPGDEETRRTIPGTWQRIDGYQVANIAPNSGPVVVVIIVGREERCKRSP